MRRNKPSARLPPHLLDRLKRLAEQEKMSVNQLVTLAVAEKPARLDAGDVLPGANAARRSAQDGLEHTGWDAPPVEGDTALLNTTDS